MKKNKKLKNCYVFIDSKGKQKGFIVKAISGSVNKDGSYEELHNSKQIFDTRQAAEKNLLATMNLSLTMMFGHKVLRNDVSADLIYGGVAVYDLTSSQVFAKAKNPIALPNPNK